MPAHSVRFDPIDLAEDPTLIPCPDCGASLHYFQGKAYCPDCEEWELSDAHRIFHLTIPLIDPYRKG